MFPANQLPYSKILGLDLRRIYEKWGPSARTCVTLSELPSLEAGHESEVKQAAVNFIQDPSISKVNFDATKVSHLLFSMRPKIDPETNVMERGTRTAEVATDHINSIISYAAAAAKAEDRIKFYLTISTQPDFRVSAPLVRETCSRLDICSSRCGAYSLLGR